MDRRLERMTEAGRTMKRPWQPFRSRDSGLNKVVMMERRRSGRCEVADGGNGQDWQADCVWKMRERTGEYVSVWGLRPEG